MVATAPLRVSASITGKESMSATTLSSALDCKKARSTNNRRPLERPGKTSGTPESNERSQILASGSPTPGAPKTERYLENSGRIATPELSASLRFYTAWTHLRHRPASSRTDLAHPSIVRKADRRSFIISIEITPGGTWEESFGTSRVPGSKHRAGTPNCRGCGFFNVFRRTVHNSGYALALFRQTRSPKRVIEFLPIFWRPGQKD